MKWKNNMSHCEMKNINIKIEIPKNKIEHKFYFRGKYLSYTLELQTQHQEVKR